MVSLIIFLLIIGLLIIVHEFGHFIAAKKLGVKVEKFSLGFGTTLFTKTKGDTQYSINLIPLGGYVKLAGDNLEEKKGEPFEYLSKAPGKRAIIIVLGPLLNYLLGFLCFWLIFFIGYPTLTTKVGTLIEGFNAKSAGIQVGDVITAVDGEKVKYWEQLQAIIHSRKVPAEIKLSVLRNEKTFDVNVKTQEKQVVDLLGQRHSVGLIGISPADDIIKVKYGILRSGVMAVEKTIELTTMTYRALWMMITGRMSLRESVTGLPGMFFITDRAVKVGFIAVLHLIAVLNISLMIFNLLPLPVLDGGHILLLAIEKIRGKSLSINAERIITQFGLTLIIALAVIVTFNDILRFKNQLLHIFMHPRSENSVFQGKNDNALPASNPGQNSGFSPEKLIK